MVSFIIIDHIILIFIYYYQINTDSHMASRGDAVPVSQEMSQESEESPHQTVYQDDEMKVNMINFCNQNVFPIYTNSLKLISFW